MVAAIAEAERKSSGEIRVYVSHAKAKHVLAAAQNQFIKLGMKKTRARNGVLIYFAPLTKEFAMVGDCGIHEKCGDVFWQEVSRDLSHRLKEGNFTEAITETIRRIGDLLANHFPREPNDKNELPNSIAGQ